MTFDSMPLFGDFPVNAAVTAVLGGAFAGYGFATRLDARDMQTWPRVTGTIVESTVEEYYSTGSSSDYSNQKLYRPKLSYDFVVEAHEYRGHRIELATTGTSWRSSAESVVRRYPVGTRVNVYYDPANPRECLLDPATAPAWANLFTGIGIVIAMGGLTWMALVIFGVVDG